MSRYIFGVGKGEIAEGAEAYLKRRGFGVKVAGKPVLTQSVGNVTFRIVNARDVPRFVGKGYDFGITGRDFCEDERLTGNGNFVYTDELGFGGGWIVLYGARRRDNPLIVVPADIQNLGGKYAQKLFSCFSILPVNGATEGYVSSGEADCGVDFMSDKNDTPEYVGTIKRNGLIVLEKLMPTQAMLLESNEKDNSRDAKAVRSCIAGKPKI